MHRCPTCRGEVKPREENPSFPFCSRRCRAVDLGRWFTGEYRVGGEPAPQERKGPREEDPERH
ncbi:MAG TPA: DNA gyrase inhibitor YacG [Myxococcales bacterium]|nr:DNA gyrase inhibitor YacG [Myxococcales bacterium]